MKPKINISRCDPGKACRVLAAPSSARQQIPKPSFPRGTKKILVPVDFSPRSDRALEYALAAPSRSGPLIVLFSATKPIPFEMDCGYGPVIRAVPDQLAIKKATTRLRAYGRRKVPANRLAKIEIGTGDPVEEIARAARTHEIDCIVICTRRQPRHDGGPETSTADQLIHRSPCPVIVLHEE